MRFKITAAPHVLVTNQVLRSNLDIVDQAVRTPTVEANTEVAAAPNLLSEEESSNIFTNEGATAKNYHTLPGAAAGLHYTFYCHDTDGIRIVAASGDTIRLSGTVSGAAGYTESTTVGSAVTLVAINATQWVATSIVGTWSTT